MVTRRGVMLLVVASLIFVSQLARGYAWLTKVEGSCANTSQDKQYWSGTNATVRGHWRIGSPIRKVELWVNELLVYENEWTSGYPIHWPPQPGSEKTWISRPFSTTQWPDGTKLELKAICYTVTGPGNQDVDDDQYAKNVGFSVGNVTDELNYTCPARAGYAKSFLGTANHSSNGSTEQGKDSVVAAITPSTVFHVSSHGTQTSFGDSYALAAGGPEHYISTITLGGAVDQKTGPDCRYNFVFLDCCHSAETVQLKDKWKTVAYAGWNGEMVDDDDYGGFVQEFYENLAAEHSVDEAHVAARKAYPLVINHVVWGSINYKVHLTYPGV